MMGRRASILAALAAALALGACAETTGEGSVAERRWSEGRLPRYAAPADAGAPRAGTPIRIGLLLPLTGDYADYGQNLLDAAALALFDQNLARPAELVPRDTRGVPDGAGAAAVDAVAAGASAIVGPALAIGGPGVVRAATASGAPILLLRGDRRLSAPGVFAMGHAPEAMTTRVVDYASRQGVLRISALAPQTAYGEAALAGLQGAAATRGIVVAQAGYISDTGSPDSLAAIVASALNAAGPNGALFLPFPAEQLPPIARAIAAVTQGGAPMLLGLDRWESVGLASLPSFGRAVYAGPDPAATADFRRRYQAAFGRAPARGAAIVYDMVLMAGYAGQSAGAKGLGAYDLTTAQGFRGVEGPFRLSRDGGVERNYAIVGVRDGRLAVVEPAPLNFEGEG